MKFIADLFSEMILFVMTLSVGMVLLFGLSNLICLFFGVEHIGVLFEIAIYTVFPIGSLLDNIYGSLFESLR